MRQECIEAVSRALGGRSLTQAEVTNIENRIAMAMRKMAAEDITAWRGMSEADRMVTAADRAARDIAADAALKRRRVALTALRHDAIKNYLERPGQKDPLEALSRSLMFYSDGKSGTLSVESIAQGIRNEAMGQMLDVFDSVKGGMLGLITDETKVLNMVRELRGQQTGDADAAKAARAYGEVSERLRDRFNRAGGNIGRLENWGFPQAHSQRLVATGGGDMKGAEARAAWVEDAMGGLDRGQYVNEDGSLMNDTQVRELLGAAWETLATNGANKIEPGRGGPASGMVANHGSAERILHFKDAESWIAYAQKYSDTSILETMLRHVDGMARDISLTETFGPNPHLQFRFWREWGVKEMSLRNPENAEKITARARWLDTVYQNTAGTKEPPVNAAFAEGMDTYRALNTAARLGSAALTAAVTDPATNAMTAIYNGLPVMQVMTNELRALNPANVADRRAALRAGLGINQYLGAMNRWGIDGMARDSQVSGRMARYATGAASAVMKFSGMNAVTRAGQQAFGSVLLDTLGDMTRAAGGLDAAPNARLAQRLKQSGITDDVYGVWKLAQPEDWRGMGDTVLTPESIYRIADADLAGAAEAAQTTPQRLREQAATQLAAFLDSETNMAIIEPGVRERSFMYRGTRRGTLGGELLRGALQFKAFPIAILMRHGYRAMSTPGGWGKGAYIAGLMGLTTVLGGIALQLGEVVSGRDPQNMEPFTNNFWTRSLLKGGGLGIFGDLMFQDYTRYGTSIGGLMGGPLGGDVEDMAKLVLGNVQRGAEGKETDVGARAVRMLKGKIPFANLWYTKAATDRMIFNQLQELVSPGYLRRMEDRARKEFGQQYYWRPGEATPRRGPDLERALPQ
ncbi:hypothetical protein [Achromobacter spanius]|uniref:Uncharacterized protein n=1 Tax=Achromobacter spanius TaxID=217203 RepID=A0AAW3I5Z1_9BURK|nr:hypothetical protein [Achromobacter spanius]KNE28169.1 hypothetical protein AFM18_08365 [Achromobacter spanius]